MKKQKKQSSKKSKKILRKATANGESEMRVYELEMRLSMVEQLLLNLGTRCWEHCGSDWAKEANKAMLNMRQI